IRKSNAADWRLRWALLEVFHCGDDRHVDAFAEEYANIVNEAGKDDETLSALLKRTERLLKTESSVEQITRFSERFALHLAAIHHDRFAPILKASSNGTHEEPASEPQVNAGAKPQSDAEKEVEK